MKPILPACGMLAVCLAVAGCAAAGPSGAPAATATAAPAPVATASSATATAAAPTTAATAASTTVMIQNFLFAPADLTVPPGATITVVNQDTANHTVTARDHSFDTGNIPGRATGTFIAPTKPGSYPYICAIHPFMTGTLTVS